MHKRRKAFVVLLLSTFAISQIPGFAGLTAHAATASTTATVTEISTLSKLSPLKLGANLSVKLEDVNIAAQDSGNILTYTLNFTNSASSSVNLVNYFSKVITAGGTTVKGTAISADSSKKKIDAKGSLTVTYYVNVGKASTVKGSKIQLFGWNFSAANYEQRIGTFTVPSNYSVAALQGESKKIELGSLPVTTKAESLHIYKFNGKVYAKAGISLTNLGTKVLTDPGYTVSLKSSGGSAFTLTLDEASSTYKVQPQEKKTLYYMTEIPSYMNRTHMTLQMVKTDETLKLSLPVSSFTLPKATEADFTVANYATKKLLIDSNTVEMQLQSANVYSESDNGIWTYQLRVKNTGSKSATLPAYELSVKSAEGYTFPISTTAFSSLVLKPLEEKIIPLSASVPLDLTQNKLQLQLIGPADSENANKIILPVAYFNIPYSLVANSTVDLENIVTNSYGSFGVSIGALQRLPWGDKDLVIAKLNIRNTTSKSITLPALSGILKVDQTDLTGTSQLISDSTSVLAAGASIQVSVMASIPYALDIKQTKIILQGTEGETTTQFLSLSTTAGTVSSVAAIEVGGAYKMTSTGKKASLQERITTVYPGTGSNIVYSEMGLTSEESRQANLSRLYAYFKTADSQYFQATVNQSQAATSPGGQTLVTFWAKLPSTVDAANLQLYVGQGIAAGKLTEAGTEATGYINTSALTLNEKDVTPLTNLSSISMFPYTLAISNTVGSLTQGTNNINLALNYSLSKDSTYDMGEYEHKLILKFTDPYAQTFEKILTYGTDLTVGSNNTYTASFTSNLYKALGGGTYSVTLYDEFQGQRIELGSQAYIIDYTSATTKTTSTSSN